MRDENSMEWQPIENAPFGVRVLIFYKPIGVTIGEQKDDYWLIDFMPVGQMCVNPTHWMPLPTPPEQE